MIRFGPGIVEFFHGGVHEKPEGPYGYLLLGLVYLWDESARALKIKSAILVRMDLKLRYPLEPPLYEDRFEYPYEDIYEENGQHFYNGYPIINYKLLSIPETLTCVVEKKEAWNQDYKRYFYNRDGALKYSVNTQCTDYSRLFRGRYTELYACVLSFDEKTMTGSGVGFDSLGKIQDFTYGEPVDSLYDQLVDEWRFRDCRPGEEAYARALEMGILNMSCKTDEQGNRVYSYRSIWE